MNTCARCGRPALKEAVVWCAVTPKGRVMVETASTTRREAWKGVACYFFSVSEASGYTVRKFRIEEVR